MARATEWMQYRQLRELIQKAIEEIDTEDGPVTICISPDLSEVYATTMPWWEDERLSDLIGSDWNIETSETIEDAIDIADLYFDLR